MYLAFKDGYLAWFGASGIIAEIPESTGNTMELPEIGVIATFANDKKSFTMEGIVFNVNNNYTYEDVVEIIDEYNEQHGK